MRADETKLLRDVYGDSVDKIVQGNTSNIVFLKSTDDSMLDTLEKMSGKTHVARKNSKQVTRDIEKLFLPNEGKVAYTMSAEERPVISYNDMAFISERNSIVFRAGDSPIWNRNETILPMSWRLFKNTIVHPGHDYSLQTIPTLSSALDFDVRQNQPDFVKMLEKRMAQACLSKDVQEAYKEAYGYSDYDISQLDIDNYSAEVMENINARMLEKDNDAQSVSPEDEDDIDELLNDDFYENIEDNTEEMQQAVQDAESKYKVSSQKIFARGKLAPNDLIREGGYPDHSLDKILTAAYAECRGDMEQDRGYFVYRNGDLYGVDGALYIKRLTETESLQRLNQAASDKNSNVYAENDISEAELNQFGSYLLTDDFYRFLANLPSWDFAKGRFDQAVYMNLAKAE